MKLTPKQSKKVGTVLWYVVSIILAIIMLVPFVWTVCSSFKPNNEIFANALSLWSDTPTLEHYENVFRQMPILKYTINSFIVAIGLVATNLIFGSLAGYSFARLQFRGRRVLFGILLSAMMIPSIVTMIPNFLIIRGFPLMGGNNIFGQGGTGMLNSLIALILPGAVGAYAVFVMKQCFESLPGDMAEAARIDGCSEFRIFWQLYLPLTKSTLSTLGFMTFISGWNAYLGPIIYNNDQNYYTLQQGMAAFSSATNVQYGSIFAGSVLSTVPVIILFLNLQKNFQKGIAFSGGK